MGRAGYAGGEGGVVTILTLGRINRHVAKARAKHPAFARNTAHKFCILFEEVGEFIKAVVWERDKERITSEAMDIIAVLVRWVEGD